MAARSLALLLLTAACTGDDSPAPLCDVSIRHAGGGATEPVMYENGAYLFVDAQCHYWVNNPSDMWQETRSGVLDAAAAATLGQRLAHGAWNALQGEWIGERVSDAGTMVFHDDAATVACVDPCRGDGVPAPVTAMRDAFHEVAPELWTASTPADTAIRAVVIPGAAAGSVPTIAWPLSRPVTDFLQPTLENDPANVAALKELRARVLRGELGFFAGSLVVSSGDDYYMLYMRDALPFEDEQGHVPIDTNF